MRDSRNDNDKGIFRTVTEKVTQTILGALFANITLVILC